MSGSVDAKKGEEFFFHRMFLFCFICLIYIVRLGLGSCLTCWVTVVGVDFFEKGIVWTFLEKGIHTM